MSDPELTDEQLEHALCGTGELLAALAMRRDALLTTRDQLGREGVRRGWSQGRIGALAGVSPQRIGRMAKRWTTEKVDALRREIDTLKGGES
jgi:hypothetical protein